jgi:dolichol-phosphate mannosyltransferase
METGAVRLRFSFVKVLSLDFNRSNRLLSEDEFLLKPLFPRWCFPMTALVVIPTYNERDNIDRLIPEILKQDPIIEVLVVDDNSPDGTGALVDGMAGADSRIHVLHRSGKLGLGSAYREGFRYALERGAEFIVEMDADFSHDPGVLPVFFEKMREFDVVIGSRYLNGVSVVNWPIRRLILSYCASVYTRIITGLDLHDCTSGFKCFRSSVLKAINLETIRSDGYSFQIEMNYRCMEQGFRLGEVPIIFIDRHAGSSKMSKRIVREAIFMVWKLKLGSLLHRATRFGRRKS